jgi:alkyl hydroperoxide reductase subunit AhpC
VDAEELSVRQAHGHQVPAARRLPSEGNVAQKFGLFESDKGITSRATVIIDKAGKVAWAQNHGLGTARDDRAIIEALKKLG